MTVMYTQTRDSASLNTKVSTMFSVVYENSIQIEFEDN